MVQCGAVFMIGLALFGKMGAAFATIPSPVIGGLLCVMFSVVTAVGKHLTQRQNRLKDGIFIFNPFQVCQISSTLTCPRLGTSSFLEPQSFSGL